MLSQCSKLLGCSLSLLFTTLPLQAASTLVYCLEASPDGFNPQLVLNGNSIDASAVPLYNRLVEFKVGSTELEPSLATSWNISNDGKTYTFHLRDNVQWHANKHFQPSRNLNSDDVIFSMMRQKDSNHPYHKVSGGTYEYFFSMGMRELIDQIEKVDDHTVKFHLTRPDAPFLANLAMSFSSILSAEYADRMQQAGTPENVDLHPVGTGPFQLQQYQKDSRILYRAFDNFWGEKAGVDRMVYSITPDATMRYAKLKKGECQAMPYPNIADLAPMQQDQNIHLYQMPGLNTGFIAFNTEKPPLDQQKIRLALTLAINKASLIDGIFQGMAVPAKNLIPPTMWGYNDKIAAYPYDPEQAKKLLQEAGVEKGFTINLWTLPVQRPYSPNSRRMAEMIQEDWAKIGVTAKLVTYEWGEYLSRLAKGEHDATLIGWTGANGDPDNFFSMLMSCGAIAGGTNYSRWCFPALDQLIQAARTEPDQQKRSTLYQQAQVIMHEQLPLYPIAHSMVHMPVRKEVKNYVIHPLGTHNFNHVSLQQKP